MVDRQGGIFLIMAQDNGGAVATSEVDAGGGPDGRRKDEIVDARKPQRFAARFAGRGVKPGKNILIVPKDIERVVIKQWRGDVGRQPIEFPHDVVGAGDVASGAGDPDGEHRL